jgi:hypothetical protein
MTPAVTRRRSARSFAPAGGVPCNAGWNFYATPRVYVRMGDLERLEELANEHSDLTERLAKLDAEMAATTARMRDAGDRRPRGRTNCPAGGQSERQSRAISSRREQIVCRRPPAFSSVVSAPLHVPRPPARQGAGVCPPVQKRAGTVIVSPATSTIPCSTRKASAASASRAGMSSSGSSDTMNSRNTVALLTGCNTNRPNG